MADIADVFSAMQAIITSVVYPNGTSSPSAILVSGVPQPARIYPGWPIPSNLDNDMAAGITNISIYAPRGFYKNTTRYPQDEFQITAPVHTITTLISGTNITIGGTESTPQNVAVVANGVGVSYGVQSSDTLTSIAAGLVALLQAAGVTCSSTGPVISIPNGVNIGATVGGAGSSIREVMRQEQKFQVTIWAPSSAVLTAPDAIRPAFGAPIKVQFAVTPFLTLSDNSAARLITMDDFYDDDVSKPNVYRRDLFYNVEYATTQTQQQYEIVLSKIQLSGGQDPNAPLIGNFVY